ncbi:MAG: hypothetical protein Q9160_003381 [Pyrenula sp. 1 TL-2023]
MARHLERVANLPSRFSSENQTEADMAWNAVVTGHGDVAIPISYAKAHNLPPSWDIPHMPGKQLYVMEAYHAMHCLKVLRKHYMAMARGQSFQWSIEHESHCFDSLRQHVMCQSDDTLLFTEFKNQAGVGQVRKCRNWDALRDFATAYTACYYDYIEIEEGKQRFNMCDGGEDGLPRGSLL